MKGVRCHVVDKIAPIAPPGQPVCRALRMRQPRRQYINGVLSSYFRRMAILDRTISLCGLKNTAAKEERISYYIAGLRVISTKCYTYPS